MYNRSYSNSILPFVLSFQLSSLIKLLDRALFLFFIKTMPVINNISCLRVVIKNVVKVPYLAVSKNNDSCILLFQSILSLVSSKQIGERNGKIYDS